MEGGGKSRVRGAECIPRCITLLVESNRKSVDWLIEGWWTEALRSALMEVWKYGSMEVWEEWEYGKSGRVEE